ncbi:MAG: hypothetical protein WD070_11455, partial [Pirellulaceae bacterium]
MQCEKFEQRLQQQLDERQSVGRDEALLEHARGCAACGLVWRAQSRLFAGLGSLPEASIGRDLGPRVLDHLRVDQRKRNTKRLWMAALATASLIMLAMLPLFGDRVQFRQKGESRNGGLALATSGQQQSIATDKLTPQETEDLRMLMRHLMLRLSDQRLGMFEPVDQLASGIRPLAITFNLAF